MDNLLNISNLNEWKEVTRGLYRFVLSAGACYEIHIIYHNHKTDILSAKASLYIVGDWRDKEGNTFFERECLEENSMLSACLEKALEYYRENMN